MDIEPRKTHDWYGSYAKSRPSVRYVPLAGRELTMSDFKALSILAGKFVRLIAPKRLAGKLLFVTAFDKSGVGEPVPDLGNDILLHFICKDLTYLVRVDFTTPPLKKCDRHWAGRMTVLERSKTPA